MTERWTDAVRWLEAIGERVGRAATIERSVQRVGAGDVSELRGVRLQLEARLEGALHGCERIRAEGVWNSELDARVGQCADLIAAWDRTCADLLANRLSGSFEFSDAHITVSQGPAGACDRCGATLSEVRGRAPLGPHPDRVRVDCPLCGERSIRRHGEGAMALGPLPALERGTSAVLQVDLSGLDDAVPQLVSPGYLVVRLRDAGRGRVFFRWAEQVTGPSCAVTVHVPPDLSAELHVVRVAWVRALDVTVERRRWPSFPVLA